METWEKKRMNVLHLCGFEQKWKSTYYKAVYFLKKNCEEDQRDER